MWNLSKHARLSFFNFNRRLLIAVFLVFSISAMLIVGTALMSVFAYADNQSQHKAKDSTDHVLVCVKGDQSKLTDCNTLFSVEDNVHTLKASDKVQTTISDIKKGDNNNAELLKPENLTKDIQENENNEKCQILYLKTNSPDALINELSAKECVQWAEKEKIIESPKDEVIQNSPSSNPVSSNTGKAHNKNFNCANNSISNNSNLNAGSSFTNDPAYEVSWWLKNNNPSKYNPNDINFEGAVNDGIFNLGAGDMPTVTAIVDSGVSKTDELPLWSDGLKYDDLVQLGGCEYGLYASSNCAGSPDSSSDGIFDTYGHGTHCSGIAAAKMNNGKGVCGVCGQNTQIMTCRQTDITTYSVINSFKYISAAKDDGVNVSSVNCSWGGASYLEMATTASLSSMVCELGSKGVVTIFSAGNSDTPLDYCPNLLNALAPYEIVVGAATDAGEKVAWSSYGQRVVDVFAPGVGILSTVPPLSMQSDKSFCEIEPKLEDDLDIFFNEDFESGVSKISFYSPKATIGDKLKEIPYEVKDGNALFDVKDICGGYCPMIIGAIKKTDIKSLFDDKTNVFPWLACDLTIADCTSLTMDKSSKIDYEVQYPFFDKDKPWHDQRITTRQMLYNPPLGNYDDYSLADDESWAPIPSTAVFNANHNYESGIIKDPNMIHGSYKDTYMSFDDDVKFDPESVLFCIAFSNISDYMDEDSKIALNSLTLCDHKQDYGYSSGTSMAAPIVTGMVSALATHFPMHNSQDTLDIISCINAGAVYKDDLDIYSVTSGNVNFKNSYDALKVMQGKQSLTPNVRPVINELVQTKDDDSFIFTINGKFFGNSSDCCCIKIDGQDVTDKIIGWGTDDVAGWKSDQITLKVNKDEFFGNLKFEVIRSDWSYGRNWLEVKDWNSGIGEISKGYTKLSTPQIDYSDDFVSNVNKADYSFPVRSTNTHDYIFTAFHIEGDNTFILRYDIENDFWSEFDISELNAGDNLAILEDISYYPAICSNGILDICGGQDELYILYYKIVDDESHKYLATYSVEGELKYDVNVDHVVNIGDTLLNYHGKLCIAGYDWTATFQNPIDKREREHDVAMISPDTGELYDYLFDFVNVQWFDYDGRPQYSQHINLCGCKFSVYENFVVFGEAHTHILNDLSRRRIPIDSHDYRNFFARVDEESRTANIKVNQQLAPYSREIVGEFQNPFASIRATKNGAVNVGLTNNFVQGKIPVDSVLTGSSLLSNKIYDTLNYDSSIDNWTPNQDVLFDVFKSSYLVSCINANKLYVCAKRGDNEGKILFKSLDLSLIGDENWDEPNNAERHEAPLLNSTLSNNGDLSDSANNAVDNMPNVYSNDAAQASLISANESNSGNVLSAKTSDTNMYLILPILTLIVLSGLVCIFRKRNSDID